MRHLLSAAGAACSCERCSACAHSTWPADSVVARELVFAYSAVEQEWKGGTYWRTLVKNILLGCIVVYFEPSLN